MKPFLSSLSVLFLLMTQPVLADTAILGKRLKNRPVTIKVVYDENELRIPGAYFTVGIEASMPDGSLLKTKNIGGKLGMRNFVVSVEGGRLLGGVCN